MDFNNIVKILTDSNKTISTMESCTGGEVASSITNIEGAGDVLKFSAVTYCNEYKVKMGVSPKIIEKYSVYSIETADEMSKNISEFTNSDYGIGVTGKLNKIDKNNPHGEDNTVFISIYDKENNTFTHDKIKAVKKSRKENKELIVKKVIEMLTKIIK